MKQQGLALLISFLAGAATILGGLLALLLRNKIRPVPFAGSLAFAGGVMIFVSFVEIYAEGLEYLRLSMKSETAADGVAMLLFFGGWILASILDGCLHLLLNRHHDRGRKKRSEEIDLFVGSADVEISAKRRREESHLTTSGAPVSEASTDSSFWSRIFDTDLVKAIIGTEDLPSHRQAMLEEDFCQDFQKIARLGYFTAFVLALHNLPEGIATFAGGAADLRFGVGLGMAIGIHNVPEGLAVAVPILFGTGSKTKAMVYTAVSGLAEPLGGLLAWSILGSDPHYLTFGLLFMITAGIMTNVAIKELLFAAIRYDAGNKITSPAFVGGMLLMGFSLIALKFTE